MGQYTSYYLYQKFEKRGTQDWLPVYPNVYSINGDGTQPTVVKNQNDEECGYEPIVEPIYRWVEVTPTSDPSTYICDECEIDYSKQYLTFVPIESATTFAFNSTYGDSISYSLDSGSTWNTLASGVSTPSVAVGQKIMWKASGLGAIYQYGIGSFNSLNKFNVEGNIMSMVSGDSFSAATTITNDSQFEYLFPNCTNLISAENLVLPATTLTSYCYGNMFVGCTNLITAPQLPATVLAENCYSYMFRGCSSLTTAPSVLPATTLKVYCYRNMFYGCTSLTTAPSLPATTLANNCYYQMFNGCSSLSAITCLATDISATNCTTNWLYGVASSGTFYKASSMSSWLAGSSGIPTNWTVNNYNG